MGQDAGPPGRVPAVFGPQRPADACPGAPGDAGRRLPQMAGDGLLSVPSVFGISRTYPIEGFGHPLTTEPRIEGMSSRWPIVRWTPPPPWIGARLAVDVEGRAAWLKV